MARIEPKFEVQRIQGTRVRIWIKHIISLICTIRTGFAKIKEIKSKWDYLKISVKFKSKI